VKHLRQDWFQYRIPAMPAHPDWLVFIAGLTHDIMITPWLIKGAMDGDAFAAYIRNALAPELQPRTVVICDNLAMRRNKAAAQTLKNVRCRFLYLPPYSSDLNPIEMAFSKLKAHLRWIGARTFDQMFDALAKYAIRSTAGMLELLLRSGAWIRLKARCYSAFLLLSFCFLCAPRAARCHAQARKGNGHAGHP